MLCEKLCLCPMQVYRKVKKHTGLPPGKYLLLYRLNMALCMLQETEYTIGEIAFHVGFSNQNNFSRAFKSYFCHRILNNIFKMLLRNG